MSGNVVFLIGVSLICISRCVDVLRAFLTDQSWFFPAIGAGIILNLAYCAWRGERWAYYLLIFLSVICLILSAVLLVAASSLGELIFPVILLIAILTGIVLLVAHPGVREFMDDQRMRFGASKI